MKHLRRKLNNKDGVSILIALVGFLAAAMIAAVIVSAAVTSAKRVANDKEENQAHLTLESAAQIVRDGIEGTVYSYDTERATGMFADEMTTAVSRVDGFNEGYSVDKAFTISLNREGVDTVDVSYEMKAGDDIYDLIFTLNIDGSNEKMYISAYGDRSGDTIIWESENISIQSTKPE